MNAIGTHLREPINSGVTRWRMTIKKINGRRRGNREESRTRFSLSMGNSRLTRDGTAELVSRNQILRRERGQGNTNDFPCSADHGRGWKPNPVDPYSCYLVYVMIIHTILLLLCVFRKI